MRSAFACTRRYLQVLVIGPTFAVQAGDMGVCIDAKAVGQDLGYWGIRAAKRRVRRSNLTFYFCELSIVAATLVTAL
ncbi:hypothetical protein WG66_014867 [Moniliophthora roreri]|nr:hypothetical protein WG66_014867 [Moniliophthora roreri]